MKPLSDLKIRKARDLRRKGLSHRDIVKKLGISLGSAFLYTQEISITEDQHLALKRRAASHLKPTKEQCRLGGLNTPSHFKPLYSKKELLAQIVDFYWREKRVPVKREISHYQVYRRLFGSWNKAVKAAGFDPNPVIFATKHVARDGHICDSLSEKIIDDWLFYKGLSHHINVRYPGDKKFTVDFLVKNCWIEFFGLTGGHPRYDILRKRKLKLVKLFKLKFVAIYPETLFPKNKLIDLLGFLIHNQS